ncbi:MAG TPA: FAD-dependent oxidoreductase, partial [Turneriella sp.]|nr:FAD-dependent oxidoreductase [Turneriella sp.]
ILASDLLVRYRIRAEVNATVEKIDTNTKTVSYRKNGTVKIISYDKLILSQGGNPNKVAVEGIEHVPHFSLRLVEDMDAIIAQMQEPKSQRVIVVGGGFIGIELAEAFIQKKLNVTLVEFAPNVMANLDTEFSNLAKETLVVNGVDVRTRTTIQKVEAGGKITLSDGSTHTVDFVVFAAGVKPETTLATQMQLQIGKSGGVVVDEFMQTSNPDVYAVGDMVEIKNRFTGLSTRIPLAGPANRQGRIAAENIVWGNKSRYAGALGSAVVKIFDTTLAFTGLTEKAANELSIEAGTVTIHGNNHAGYYPNAERITLKLIFDTKDGRVLGATAFGKEGTEKRIDVIATALVGKLTVYDLATLDLCYAPPYGSANDVVNVAAFQAINHLSKLSPVVTPAALDANRADFNVVDVRISKERDECKTECQCAIEVDTLRECLSDVPCDKPVALLCQSGQRSYIASRILKQK